ncbi:hypothetical protein CSW37_06145 [Thermus scotoductus]|uniref:Uncharacterized protein n=1 Tax=Thermus scotoductus TaxID=37636 RepID=A0A430SFA8_THESC|nr:hypothetical protein [Thermus scotoductus]RTH37505.1 hypothetical protein CSW37_06145 [Thermus scotoductus]
MKRWELPYGTLEHRGEEDFLFVPREPAWIPIYGIREVNWTAWTYVYLDRPISLRVGVKAGDDLAPRKEGEHLLKSLVEALLAQTPRGYAKVDLDPKLPVHQVVREDIVFAYGEAFLRVYYPGGRIHIATFGKVFGGDPVTSLAKFFEFPPGVLRSLFETSLPGYLLGTFLNQINTVHEASWKADLLYRSYRSLFDESRPKFSPWLGEETLKGIEKEFLAWDLSKL